MNSLNVSDELQAMIDKIERIVATSNISNEELCSVIKFVESIDSENTLLLNMIMEHKDFGIDNVIEVLKHYNVLPSNNNLFENKSIVLRKCGTLVKEPFDIYKYNVPKDIQNIIEKIKDIIPKK